MEDASMIAGDDDVRPPMTHDQGMNLAVDREENDDNVGPDDDGDDEMDQAAAAAQVALMDGHFNNRTGRGGNQANRAAEEAILGAATDDAVEAYMDQDESGNLVQQRFLQFLESL